MAQVKSIVFRYIMTYYNRQRIYKRTCNRKIFERSSVRMQPLCHR